MGTGQVVCRVPCGALAVVSPSRPPATWRTARPPRAPAVSCSGRSRAAHRLRPGGGPRPRGRDEHDPWVLRMRTKPRSLAERVRVGMLHAACLLGCATDSAVCCTKALALANSKDLASTRPCAIHVRDHTDRTPRAVRPVASLSRATEPCLPCPRRSVPRRHRSKPR